MLGTLAKSTWVSWLGRWFLWFLATTGGLTLGGVVASAANSAVAKVLGVPEAHLGMVLPFLAVLGAGLGASQWLVLRLWVKGAEWWVLATATPFAVFGGVLATGAPEAVGWSAWPDPVNFGVVGAFLGASQWLVLRRWARRAGWWVLVTAVAWALTGAGEFPIEMAQIGAITGVAMMALLAQESRH